MGRAYLALRSYDVAEVPETVEVNSLKFASAVQLNYPQSGSLFDMVIYSSVADHCWACNLSEHP